MLHPSLIDPKILCIKCTAKSENERKTITASIRSAVYPLETYSTMVDGKSAESGPTATVSGTQIAEITIIMGLNFHDSRQTYHIFERKLYFGFSFFCFSFFIKTTPFFYVFILSQEMQKVWILARVVLYFARVVRFYPIKYVKRRERSFALAEIHH